jgi:hypothetical protein
MSALKRSLLAHPAKNACADDCYTYGNRSCDSCFLDFLADVSSRVLLNTLEPISVSVFVSHVVSARKS